MKLWKSDSEVYMHVRGVVVPSGPKGASKDMIMYSYMQFVLIMNCDVNWPYDMWTNTT